MKDYEDRDVGLLLISAYAPDSSHPDEVWDEFIEKLEVCIQRKRPNDILIIGTDTYSSMGVSCDKSSSIGPFGISHVNEAGRKMRTFLCINDLIACSTYFQKRNYGTWQHPRSKKMHQIDHIITAKSNFKCFTDTGITVNSDLPVD